MDEEQAEMLINPHPPTTRIDPGPVDDERSIATLTETLTMQRAAVAKAPYPSERERREYLRALMNMMRENRLRIREALLADFSTHSAGYTDVIEVASVIGRAQTAIDSLPRWMAPDKREVPDIFGDGSAYMHYQPKGVVGNIVPWNLPFELSCGPLVEMLAAGNRVIMKPSEYTPSSGHLLREMIASTFDRDHVDVVIGGVDLATAFAAQPWDHLLYTGSTEIGRKVMEAAARNLVPLTLELGGKCPTIISSGRLNADTMGSILGLKLVKNGQVCVSVDHVLVPRGEVDEFVLLAREQYRRDFADHSRSDDCTAVITDRHLARIVGLIDEARSAGAKIVSLEDNGIDMERRTVPLTLIVDPDPGLGVMNQEIFGPIMPVIPYDGFDDAIAKVNRLGRPLCINLFSDHQAEADRIIAETWSGGVTVNGAALNAACLTLGFGGIGQSGMGKHHGIEGFRSFSNDRAIFVRGTHDKAAAIFPPFGEEANALIAAALES